MNLNQQTNLTALCLRVFPRSLVRQFRTLGSARGASSNRRPYLNLQKMKTTARHILLIILALCVSCAAEPKSDEKNVTDAIEMKKTSKNGITSFTFSMGDTNIYRILFKDVIYQRAFLSRGGLDTNIRVQEYDLDLDGKLDAIQIGADDKDFTPFLVSIEEGRIEIEALPENWQSGSEYPYDAFISFVKKRKGIK